MRFLLYLCAGLLLIDLVNLGLHLFKHKGYFLAEGVPNFYGFWGFLACLVLVWLAGPVRAAA